MTEFTSVPTNMPEHRPYTCTAHSGSLLLRSWQPAASAPWGRQQHSTQRAVRRPADRQGAAAAAAEAASRAAHPIACTAHALLSSRQAGAACGWQQRTELLP